MRSGAFLRALRQACAVCPPPPPPPPPRYPPHGCSCTYCPRLSDLLPSGRELPAGVYRISWDTAEYMARCRAVNPGFFAERPFFPSVSVEFEVSPHQTREHFHVPLTWNPYGYSTYRGS